MKNLEAYKYPLNIQLFADEGEGAGTGADDKNDNEGTGTDDKDQGSKAKTFTQEEVNALIGKEKAKFQKKLKELSSLDEGESKKNESEGKVDSKKSNPYLDKYAQAEVKVAMTMNGIDPQKVARAVRLIDTSEVLTDEGEVDAEKLNKAIADLVKEWPELKQSAENGRDGFKFGSDSKKDKGKTEDLISKAFGNTK